MDLHRKNRGRDLYLGQELPEDLRADFGPQEVKVGDAQVPGLSFSVHLLEPTPSLWGPLRRYVHGQQVHVADPQLPQHQLHLPFHLTPVLAVLDPAADEELRAGDQALLYGFLYGAAHDLLVHIPVRTLEQPHAALQRLPHALRGQLVHPPPELLVRHALLHVLRHEARAQADDRELDETEALLAIRLIRALLPHGHDSLHTVPSRNLGLHRSAGAPPVREGYALRGRGRLPAGGHVVGQEAERRGGAQRSLVVGQAPAALPEQGEGRRLVLQETPLQRFLASDFQGSAVLLDSTASYDGCLEVLAEWLTQCVLPRRRVEVSHQDPEVALGGPRVEELQDPLHLPSPLAIKLACEELVLRLAT
mmetsp:Transcript_101252/g.294859  ORF Transcript_101252/g.294859 Transcript_101252/m.294859 type:complete len:363 (-) Transcript_101252:165-1253(-)